jgi:two-component sensor histidine kinase
VHGFSRLNADFDQFFVRPSSASCVIIPVERRAAMDDDQRRNAKVLKRKTVMTRAPDNDPAALQAQLNSMRGELARAEAACKAAEERAALLQGELQHRVRNMLGVIRSVFSRTVDAWMR